MASLLALRMSKTSPSTLRVRRMTCCRTGAGVSNGSHSAWYLLAVITQLATSVRQEIIYPYYVGIDGGGARVARIRDEAGQLIGEGKSGSANILLGVEVR